MTNELPGISVKRPVINYDEQVVVGLREVAQTRSKRPETLRPEFFIPASELVSSIVTWDEIKASFYCVDIEPDSENLGALSNFIFESIAKNNRPESIIAQTRQAGVVPTGSGRNEASLVVGLNPHTKNDRTMVLKTIASYHRLPQFPKQAMYKYHTRGVRLTQTNNSNEKSLARYLSNEINRKNIIPGLTMLGRISVEEPYASEL